jgi:hypothetical protein
MVGTIDYEDKLKNLTKKVPLLKIGVGYWASKAYVGIYIISAIFYLNQINLGNVKIQDVKLIKYPQTKMFNK